MSDMTSIFPAVVFGLFPVIVLLSLILSELRRIREVGEKGVRAIRALDRQSVGESWRAVP